MDGDINYLQHYGVIGMKWGVHRARKKAAANSMLEKKALKYDIKSAKMTKKSEKIHANEDLGRSNRHAKKAANYDIRAAKLSKKALNADSETKRVKLESKAAEASYKASIHQMKANKLSKETGYGAKAMKYSIKSDRAAKKAAKARMHMAKNDRYIEMMQRKASTISREDLDGAYAFVNEFMGA